ncbi:MAG: response regulator transcription factor [Actinomycetota bacterium]|nr:response regulator transcription factor [Actinomycetota bacterium]
MSPPDSEPVRVLIVDDQALIRQALKTLLDLESGIEVVGEAADGIEALELVPGTRPDVALVDVRMPRMDGIELVKRLAEEHPRVAAVILTTFDDDEYVFEGLRAGALGYLLKDTSSGELVSAIEKASRGEVLLGGYVASKVVSELRRVTGGTAKGNPTGALSERELEVLRLVAAGFSNREIARELYITEGTVKNHISNVLRKLDLRDRTQAAFYAVERGWI